MVGAAQSGRLSPAFPRSAAVNVFLGVQSVDESDPAFRNGIVHYALECHSERFADAFNE